MSKRTEIALTEEEILAFVGGQRKPQPGTIDPDGTAPMVTMVHGRARAVPDPNEIRYVGREAVRKMTGRDDPEAVAAFAEATADKRHAYHVEPDRVASWNHRKLAGQ